MMIVKLNFFANLGNQIIRNSPDDHKLEIFMSATEKKVDTVNVYFWATVIVSIILGFFLALHFIGRQPAVRNAIRSHERALLEEQDKQIASNAQRIADSVFFVQIGQEENPLCLSVMNSCSSGGTGCQPIIGGQVDCTNPIVRERIRNK